MRAWRRAPAALPGVLAGALAASGCEPARVEVEQVETIALAASDWSPQMGRVTYRREEGIVQPIVEVPRRLLKRVAVEGPARLGFHARVGARFPGAASRPAIVELGLQTPGGGSQPLARRELRSEGFEELSVDGLALPEGRSVLVLSGVHSEGGNLLLVDPVVELRRVRRVVRRPRANVMIVTADTTRADALSPWGGPPTPGVESLARDGIVFEDAHSVAFGTTPSHASLFTGQAAALHGVYDNATRLGGSVTLAERLRDEGYQTAAFVSAAPLSRAVGLDRGFLAYDDLFAEDDESGLGEFALHERRGDLTVSRFEAWMRRRPTDTPFFVWLHFYDPHQPYAPPGPQPDEAARLGRLFGAPGAPHYLTPEEIAREPPGPLGEAGRRRYLAEVAFLDRQLTRALDLLRSQGIYDQTLVVFVSDHGENLIDRGSLLAFNHASLLPEVTRLGLVVKLPGGELAGLRRAGLVANRDLACLVARALGVDAAPTWSCRGVLTALRSGAPLTRRQLVLEGAARGEVAIRSERWLMRTAGPEIADADLGAEGFDSGRVQLYDLARDADCRHDLVASGRAPAAELAQLRQLVDAVRAVRARPGARAASDAHLQALRALGYTP